MMVATVLKRKIVKHAKVKQALRKSDANLLRLDSQHKCTFCSRICLFRTSLTSHMRHNRHNKVMFLRLNAFLPDQLAPCVSFATKSANHQLV